MLRTLRWVLPLVLAAPLGCGGGCGSDLGPVPGGFAPERRISRALQVRLTQSGLDVLADAISSMVRSDSSISCGVDSDCPSGFVDGAGGAIVPTCGQGRCLEAGAAGPYLEVDVPASTQTNLQICPPSASACRAVIRFVDADLSSVAGVGLEAALALQLSAQIAVRDPGSGLDCQIRITPPLASPGTAASAAFDLAVHAPTGAITLGVPAVQLSLPSGAISVVADPVTGDAQDIAACPSAPVSAQIVAELEAQLGPGIQGLLTSTLGWGCSSSGQCPAQSSCDLARGLCVEDATARVLFDPLAYDTRLQLPALLGELGYRGTSGQVDTAISVGGAVDIDALGMSLGVLAGLEAPAPNPQCATITDSPVTRPGFVAPRGLPPTDRADLDFDGTPETDYDLAFGISDDLLGQLAWGVYTSGLLCGVIGQEEFGDLSTGTLQLLIPSVRFLTKSHLYPRAEAPARLSIYMRNEPRVVIRSGEVLEVGGTQQWNEPLVRLDLDDVEINLSALIDERYVRIMTITLDAHVGIGALVTPNNQIEPILGVGVANLVTDVRVTNSELLAESAASLENTIPTLISLIVLELSGSQGQIDIPAFPGLDLTILGIRGEPPPGGGTGYQSVAVYADAQASMQGNLHAAADTHLEVLEVVVPPTQAFSVTHPGGPVWPQVRIATAAEAPIEAPLETQIRIDGGPWGPFSTASEVTLRRPELLIQGRHVIEARARIRGRYRTLDPTPARAEVVIDSVAPHLEVTVDRRRGGAEIDVWDRVGPVTVFEVTPGSVRDVTAEADGFVAIEALTRPGRVALRAVDGAGNVTERVLQAAAESVPAEAPVASGGCRCVSGSRAPSGILALGLLLIWRRRQSADVNPSC